jgi:segregation and condensation protein B
MAEPELKYIVEGALLAAGEPLSVDRLRSLFSEERQPEAAAVRQALFSLAQDYEGRGVELKEVSSGFRIQVRDELAPWVSRLWEEKPGRYSRALLETLAIIAYRQPITRGEIEDIRGVSVSSSIMRTLHERGWVRTVGHRDVPGRPAMVGTTRAFLDYFNLKSLDELPTLMEIRDLDKDHPELDLQFPEEASRSQPEPEKDDEERDGDDA